MIEVEPFENGTFDVRVKSSGKLIGAFYPEVDGYYYFHPFEGLKGAWTQEALIEIGKELAKINEDYDKKVSEEFNKAVEEEHQGNNDILGDFITQTIDEDLIAMLKGEERPDLVPVKVKNNMDLFDFTDFSADNYRGEDDRLTKDEWISAASNLLIKLASSYERSWKDREPTEEEQEKIMLEGEESVEGLSYNKYGEYEIRYFDDEEFSHSVEDDVIYGEGYGVFELVYYHENLKD